MTRIRKIVAMLLAFVMVTSIATTPAHAAAKTFTTGGNGHSGVTFTIKTGSTTASRNLEFNQRKGTYSYQNIATGTSKVNVYGKFVIYVQKQGGSAKMYYCSYKQSLTVKLDKNSTYKVSIVPTQNQFTYSDLLDTNKLKGAKFFGFSYGVGRWTTYPEYTISTKGSVSNVNHTTLSSSIY